MLIPVCLMSIALSLALFFPTFSFDSWPYTVDKDVSPTSSHYPEMKPEVSPIQTLPLVSMKHIGARHEVSVVIGLFTGFISLVEFVIVVTWLWKFNSRYAESSGSVTSVSRAGGNTTERRDMLTNAEDLRPCDWKHFCRSLLAEYQGSSRRSTISDEVLHVSPVDRIKLFDATWIDSKWTQGQHVSCS